MELKNYLDILLRRAWIILLALLAACGAAYYATTIIPPLYHAETALRVMTPVGGNVSYVQYETWYANRLMNTYARIAASDRVMDELKDRLGIDELPDIEVVTVPDSEIIQITVESQDAELAASAANMLADIIIAENQETSVEIPMAAEDISILDERLQNYEKELATAKTDYEAMIEPYSRTVAQMAGLDRSIMLKEQSYQQTQDQLLQAQIVAATEKIPARNEEAVTTVNLLKEKMVVLDNELKVLRQQYQDLAMQSAESEERLTAARQVIQTKEQVYTTLLSQYDSVRIARAIRVGSNSLQVATPAVVPNVPVGPQAWLILAVGGLLGLMSGVILAFIAENLDNRVFTVEQVEQAANLPVVGRIPVLHGKDRRDPAANSDTAAQKGFWALRTRILGFRQVMPVKSILVTSTEPGEGKSTTLFATAASLVKLKQRVLVIDGDLRLPKQHKFFGVNFEPGLSNVLKDEINLDQAVLHDARPGMDFLPSGPTTDAPADLLTPDRLAPLLQELTRDYDMILFDAPSMVVTDASSLAQIVDGVLVVVQLGRTMREAIHAVCSQLISENARVLGVVVTRVRARKKYAYYDRRALHSALPSRSDNGSVYKPVGVDLKNG